MTEIYKKSPQQRTGTKVTFEERIDELIAKKGQLMEEVVGIDEQRS